MISNNDEQIAEQMLADLFEKPFTTDGNEGDLGDHLQRIAATTDNQIKEVISTLFERVMTEAANEADKRGADDGRDVWLTLLSSMPMTVTSNLMTSINKRLLVMGVSGIVSVNRGKLSVENAGELFDDSLAHASSEAKAQAMKSFKRGIKETLATVEARDAIDRARSS